jgi:chorismate mutase/GNAT superfamily N-acetyltransferase
VGSTDPDDDADVEVTGVLLRPAGLDEIDRIAEVHLAARKAAIPAMPAMVHPDSDAAPYLRGRMAACETWVAELEGRIVGYALVERGFLDHLYVLPDHAGQGIGSALLDVVKAVRPGGFGLWVFESNEPARRFYRRHGLVELETTDGSTNEERSPDIRMAWEGEDPLAFLRRQIDEADDDLSLVLARRAALTARIQEHKHVRGHEGRDPEREDEIVQRLAAKAPALGADGWRRVIEAVITASLDAAERSAERGR